jgi:23S rRNA pseudouridine955/2504/2580 synthase
VSLQEAGQRLDNYVQKRLGGVPRSRVYRVIRKGEVRVNGRRAGPETRLQLNDRIRIPPVRVLPPAQAGKPSAQLCERIRTAIVYQDEKLLVLDKPAGIAVHGGSGVSFGVIEALRALRPDDSLELVHRLDRDTSGCLLVARHAGTLRSLHALLRTDGLEKRYLALLRGKWELGARRIDVPLSEASVPCARRPPANPRSATSVRCSSSAARRLWWKSRCAPAALTRSACTRSTPHTRWRGMKSTAMPPSTTSCARSA